MAETSWTTRAQNPSTPNQPGSQLAHLRCSACAFRPTFPRPPLRRLHLPRGEGDQALMVHLCQHATDLAL